MIEEQLAINLALLENGEPVSVPYCIIQSSYHLTVLGDENSAIDTEIEIDAEFDLYQ